MKFLIFSSSFLILAGCSYSVKLNNSNRLINRTDFEAARQAAPEWCRDALKTINELEWKLEEL